MLTQLQLLSLYVGGRDGGKHNAASNALTNQVIHMIECLEDTTVFSVLSGKDQDGTARNYITTNDYGGEEWKAGTLIFAPTGGFIDTVTADKRLRYYRMPTTSRIQIDS